MPRNTSNLNALATKLLDSGNGFKAVSFDVFDTLVHRTLPHPDTTKLPAVREVQRQLEVGSQQQDIDALFKLRLRAEHDLRSRAADSGADPECRLDDVFCEWLSRTGLDSSENAVRRLMKIEMESELKVVYPARGMPDLLDQLKNRGVLLFYTSDMYLRRWMIEKILDHCGYADTFVRGYVSCEEMKAKYSGRLFEQLLTREGLQAAELIHVGDKAEPDIQGAAKAGVHALKFSDPNVVQKQATQVYLDSLRRGNPFWEGARWSDFAIATSAHKERCEGDLRYRLGYQYLGPLFTNFVHRVLHKVKQSGTDLVLFNSREGFLLHALYHRIAAAEFQSEFPPSRYAYLTRKSIYAASLKKFGEREIDMGFHTTTPSLRNMFIRYSLPENELENIAYEAGFESLDVELHDPGKSAELKRFISHPQFISILRRTREDAAAILYDYLEQIDFWNCDKVAVVDVGWNGTAQEALAEAFCHLPENPLIEGYYMALLGGKIFKEKSNSKYFGIYHDYRKVSRGIAFSRFVELFETACRAPHATVVGFTRRENGDVTPVLKDSNSIDFEQEQKDDSLISSIQSGIFDYCDDYTRTLEFRDRKIENSSQYILFQVDRLLRFPTTEEARVLSSFSHSEDFGQSLVHVPDNTAINQTDRSGHEPTPFRRRTLWREGDMVTHPFPGLNSIYNFYRLFRTRSY